MNFSVSDTGILRKGKCEFSHDLLRPVVPKPINANPRLKVNRGFLLARNGKEMSDSKLRDMNLLKNLN